MDMGETRTRSPNRISRVSKQMQLERRRAYQEAMESAALSREHYEAVKMEATVKAFVDGSKKKADVAKYISEEARQAAQREREERTKEKTKREQRVCITAVSMAVLSVLLAMYFVMLRH